MTIGTDNIKKEIDLAIGVVTVIKQAKADGKIDLTDLQYLMGLLPLVQPAVEGMSQVVPEFKDLSTEEAQDLAAYVMTKLGAADSHSMIVVQKALAFLVAGYELEQAVFYPVAPAAV